MQRFPWLETWELCLDFFFFFIIFNSFGIHGFLSALLRHVTNANSARNKPEVS